MTVPVLSNLSFYGNEIDSAVLQAPKIGSEPSSPEAGHFYMKNGVLYYRTAQNVERPVHEDAITDIISGGVGSLNVSINGTQATISIAEADSTDAGLLSVDLFDLLNGATENSDAFTLVKRDDTGGAQFAVLTASSVSTNNVNGLSSNQDNDSDDYAVSLGYFRTQLENVQSAIASRDFKENVRVALRTNLALSSGAGTYDGVAIAVGDSIALINQTNPVQNGVYTVGASSLTRRADSNDSTVMTPGATYAVSEGTLSGRLIMLVTPTGFTVGQDSLSFLAIDDSASAGDGLTKSGNTIHAVGTSGRVAVSADAIDIDPDWDGSGNQITVLGNVTEGEWSASAIGISYGGTGAITEEEALTNLGAVQEEEEILLGNGSATSFTISSNLNSASPQIETFFLVSGEWIKTNADVRVNASTNVITIHAQQGQSPIGNNTLKVIVRGRKY